MKLVYDPSVVCPRQSVICQLGSAVLNTVYDVLNAGIITLPILTQEVPVLVVGLLRFGIDCCTGCKPIL